MDLIYSCLDPFSKLIQGFVDIDSSLGTQDILFIPTSISTKIIPDHRGNIVKFKKIRLFTPERDNQCYVKKDNTHYLFHKKKGGHEKKYFFKLSYFSYNEKEINRNFLKINNSIDYRHPRFTKFYPITNFPFSEVYDGYSFIKASNFICKTNTQLFRKSFYKGPGKDERFYEVQKLDFNEPENTYFFSDILQVFNIKLFDENSDHYLNSIISSEGPGFYRIINQYLSYSSQFNWLKIEDRTSTNDILNWMDNKKMVEVL